MTIVFLAHPSFLDSQSMPRYASYLLSGMVKRGHKAELWQPQPKIYNWPAPRRLKKWLGYVDQYVLFPRELKQRINQLPENTLFVLTDHALGPYVPLIAGRPHVIHCHDFLAQNSALGKWPENPTSWTGRRYQAFIRWGFSKGKNFISISGATQHDLHRLLGVKPAMSEIIYNSLLDSFSPTQNSKRLRKELQDELAIHLSEGFILHVGGNQWYKNRKGVIQIYNAWCALADKPLPLLLVGSPPSESLLISYTESTVKENIYFLTDVSDALVKKLYQAASLLLFPSLAEGFGWPIIEAMASGCPVITTDAAPMSEVAGKSAFLIPRHTNNIHSAVWAMEAARIVQQVIQLSAIERDAVVASGLYNIQRFNSDVLLNKIEQFYKNVSINGYIV